MKSDRFLLIKAPLPEGWTAEPFSPNDEELALSLEHADRPDVRRVAPELRSRINGT